MIESAAHVFFSSDGQIGTSFLLTKPFNVTGWRRSHRPSIRDISIIDEEELAERDTEAVGPPSPPETPAPAAYSTPAPAHAITVQPNHRS